MEGKVCNIRMEPVENGHKITCCFKKKQLGASDYEPMMTDYKEYVFSDKESKEAFDKYEELVKMSKAEYE